MADATKPLTDTEARNVLRELTRETKAEGPKLSDLSLAEIFDPSGTKMLAVSILNNALATLDGIPGGGVLAVLWTLAVQTDATALAAPSSRILKEAGQIAANLEASAMPELMDRVAVFLKTLPGYEPDEYRIWEPGDEETELGKGEVDIMPGESGEVVGGVRFANDTGRKIRVRFVEVDDAGEAEGGTNPDGTSGD